MELTELREDIRRCDEEIIALIAERTELAKLIGEKKISSGLPIKNPEIEEKVRARYREIGKSKGLSEETMDKISGALITEAVMTENKIKDKKE